MFRKFNNKGFTIVETLIVLAIAATIIIVVLLAVPGLQRSSRNTSVRTAATNVVSGWNEQMAALNGTAPAISAVSAGSITINSVVYKVAGSVTPYFGAVNAAGTTISGNASTTAFTTGGATGTLAPGGLVVLTGAVCGAAGATTAGTSTQVAVLYPTESGATTPTVNCIQG
jgi:type II secretory pathway pseudopilin PulG